MFGQVNEKITIQNKQLILSYINTESTVSKKIINYIKVVVKNANS